MVYRGHVANGVIHLDESIVLPEGAAVHVELAETDDGAGKFHDCIERELDRLAALKSNWDREGAQPIEPAIIQAARRFAAKLPSGITTVPTVVPSATGNLQFEWNSDRRSLELEVEDPSVIHYLKWDPTANVEEEEIFDIDDVDRAVALIRWFARGSTNV